MVLGGSPGSLSCLSSCTEGFLLPTELFFPQDPPSEPGSPGRSPSRRRELPESPASVGSSGSTAPPQPKEQSPVGAPALGVGCGASSTALNFSLWPVCCSAKRAQKCQGFVPTATPQPPWGQRSVPSGWAKCCWAQERLCSVLHPPACRIPQSCS